MGTLGVSLGAVLTCHGKVLHAARKDEPQLKVHMPHRPEGASQPGHGKRCWHMLCCLWLIWTAFETACMLQL
jgi:hypothetical protein